MIISYFAKAAAIVAVSVLTLAGCTASPAYSGASGVSRVDPAIAMPRISGSSTGGVVRARAATQIGNRQMPASVSLRATTGPRGVEVAPVFRSKYINWQF